MSPELTQLVQSLFQKRSLLDRVRGRDGRPGILARIAESRDIRVVPTLLSVTATDDALAPHVARAIGELVRGATSGQLYWLDEQVRDSDAYDRPDAWHRLPPGAVPRLAQAASFQVAVVGLLASHPNGFVRAAALDVLAQHTSGHEIPYLALRANDWVEPVADRARDLLVSRVRPANRAAVLNALPVIVRVLGQQRRDHRALEGALQAVLLSDEGEEALARAKAFDTSARRKIYELLTDGGTTGKRRLLGAALKDGDAVIRGRAIRFIAADPELEDRAALLGAALRDRAPAVRRLALAALAEHLPERVPGVFPHVLLDRAASVRALARFVARRHQPALTPKAVYVEALVATPPERLAAAIEGVGETGTGSDADLVAPFMTGNRARVRRAALGALARLDAARAIPAAVAALADDSWSVRKTAARIVSSHARRVNFDLVSGRLRSLPDPNARRQLLRVLLDAPKWEAPAFLLEALTDPDDGVRTVAARLIDRWIETFNRNQTPPTASQLQRIDELLDAVSSRMPGATEKMLRFSMDASQPTIGQGERGGRPIEAEPLR